MSYDEKCVMKSNNILGKNVFEKIPTIRFYPSKNPILCNVPETSFAWASKLHGNSLANTRCEIKIILNKKSPFYIRMPLGCIC